MPINYYVGFAPCTLQGLCRGESWFPQFLLTFQAQHSLINMMTSDQFFRLEKDNPHNHIRWFNKITSTIKYKDVPNSVIKLMLFPFSLAGAARRWLEKEPPRSILTWEFLVSKFINEFFPPSRTTNLRNEISNFQQRFDESFHEAWDRYKDLLRACPHHGFTEQHQLDTFYNALNPADQDSLNSVAGGNLLERSTQDVLTIIENKSKVRNSRNKLVDTQVKSSDGNSSSSSNIAKLAHAVNQQTSACLAADGNTFAEYQDNIQGYVVAAAGNYNHGNSGYRPPVVPLSELEKIKKINDVNIKAMQAQINNVKNELRNEMQTSIQASMSNQTNELKNMMASFFQMNTASTSGSRSLPSNTVANLRGELKSIATRSGLVLDGPSVPMPPSFINPEEDKRVEETITDLELAEYTIKVPPPLVQKAKPTSLKNYVVYQRDPLRPNIPYTLRMNQEKRQEKDEILKSLLSNKEKLLELANTPLNENCSAVILKKLPEKLGDPGKFFIPCGFSLPELLSTCMTLKLANRTICTPAGIARDVFVPVGKFTFHADFIIVDYESDPHVLLLLGRPFLRTAHALIDVHGEEMILHDDAERLILNMRNDTSRYSNTPQKESINMIDIYNISHEEYLEDLLANEKITNHPSGNPTYSLTSHTDLTSPEVNFDIIDPMFTDEHALDYSSPPLWDDYDDELFDLETVNDDTYDDPFDSKEEKIKDSKILIDELDPPRSSDFLPSPECDSVLYEDFLITIRVTPDKNVKKLSSSNASLILKDFNPPLYGLPFHKEVPGSETPPSFSSENEEKVFNPGILTSKGVHTSLLPELSHRGPKAFKVIKIFESPMEIFPCSYGEDIRVLDVPCLHFYPP
ncbi:reverse transcriptase domain-containing protein [Tanacetum coccineum]